MTLAEVLRERDFPYYTTVSRAQKNRPERRVMLPNQSHRVKELLAEALTEVIKEEGFCINRSITAQLTGEYLYTSPKLILDRLSPTIHKLQIKEAAKLLHTTNQYDKLVIDSSHAPNENLYYLLVEDLKKSLLERARYETVITVSKDFDEQFDQLLFNLHETPRDFKAMKKYLLYHTSIKREVVLHLKF